MKTYFSTTSVSIPILARMLSADPFVANSAHAQDYNRYSYVRNNPLKYTDPSGYIIDDRPYGMGKRLYMNGRTWFSGVLFNFFNSELFEYTGHDVSWVDNFSFIGPLSLESYSSTGSIGTPGSTGTLGGGLGFALSSFSMPETNLNNPIPRWLIRFPTMVDFRRNVFSDTHRLPWHWGIRMATTTINIGWNYNVTNQTNQINPNFNFNNPNWFRLNVNWQSFPGIAVTGTIDGTPANAFNNIRPDGIAVDNIGLPVVGFNALYNNGANISLNFPPGTMYDIKITTRERKQINIPYLFFLDLGWSFFGVFKN